jgi:modulator of FtsH protease
VNCGSLNEWNTLLSVQAGAAATLTGLVFVAVSLNLNKIITVTGLSGRAAESILQLVEVFFIATVGLIPRQSTDAFAIEVLGIGAFFYLAQAAGQIRYLRSRKGHPWSWFVYRAVMGQLGTIPFCIAGVTLLLGNCSGVNWLVPGFILSFAAALVSAWVLLVEILR